MIQQLLLLVLISVSTAVSEKVTDNNNVKLTLYLKEDLTSLREIVRTISDPTSNTYGEYLSQKEISDITRPKQEDVKIMTSWLEENEIAYQMNLDFAKVDVWMSISEAEKTFETKFSTRSQTGQEWRIPDEIANVTQAVFHLRGLPLPGFSPISSLQAESIANVTPAVLSKTYQIEGVKVSGSDTNRAAVAEFQGQFMKDSDLAEFFKSYVETYTVGVDDVVYKYVGDKDSQSGQTEASLDIQYIMGTAPHVKTEFWLWKGMDFCADLKNWTETILSTSSPPLVHSISYGWYVIIRSFSHPT